MIGGFVGRIFDNIVIRNDGTIVWEHFENKIKITKSGKIIENEFQEFKELIINADVFGLEDNYGGIVYDGILTSITFTIDTESKTISTYFPENLHEKLTAIIQKISEFKDRL